MKYLIIFAFLSGGTVSWASVNMQGVVEVSIDLGDSSFDVTEAFSKKDRSDELSYAVILGSFKNEKLALQKEKFFKDRGISTQLKSKVNSLEERYLVLSTLPIQSYSKARSFAERVRYELGHKRVMIVKRGDD